MILGEGEGVGYTAALSYRSEGRLEYGQAGDINMVAQTLSSGAVVVRRTPQGILYLVLRAYQFWDFPKGLPERGETPFLAAKREIGEETGIQKLSFPFGERFVETEPYRRNKIARYYLAETTEQALRLPISSELGRPEHHEYRWLPYAEARKLLVSRLQRVLDWAQGILEKGE